MDEAAYLTAGAERARVAGDDVAMVALLVAASQRLELHKLFEAEPGMKPTNVTRIKRKGD